MMAADEDSAATVPLRSDDAGARLAQPSTEVGAVLPVGRLAVSTIPRLAPQLADSQAGKAWWIRGSLRKQLSSASD